MNRFVKFLFSFSIFAVSSGAFAGIMLMDEMLQPAAGAVGQPQQQQQAQQQGQQGGQQQQAQAGQQARPAQGDAAQEDAGAGGAAQADRSSASVEANNLRSQLRRVESDLASCRTDLASLRPAKGASEAIKKELKKESKPSVPIPPATAKKERPKVKSPAKAAPAVKKVAPAKAAPAKPAPPLATTAKKNAWAKPVKAPEPPKKSPWKKK